jgi:UDP-N-acetylmuramate dehydrogenase
MSSRSIPTLHFPKLVQFVDTGVGGTLFDAPLADHNSWQIGGPADLLIEPETIAQVARVVSFARRHEIPLMVIGQGTNLLFDDSGLRGIVLKLGERFSRVEISGNKIVAEAGAWVPGLARKAMLAGLSGLEHTIGIPGTLGGLVLMNNHDECAFSYRRSALQGSGAVVVKAELECEKQEPQCIRRLMLEDLRERRRKFPRKQPNCGSVFLSTSEMHASVGPPGKVIEDAGLKGVRIGKAEVSHQHANFIVNLGGATSEDVLSLIAHIRKVVHERIGFELSCEVRYVSPTGDIIPAHQAVV